MAANSLLNVPTPKQRLAAFDLGISLSQLDWHRTQALMTLYTVEIHAVTQLLEDLQIQFVRLLPVERGGVLKETAKGMLKSWKYELEYESLDRKWKRFRSSLTPDYDQMLTQTIFHEFFRMIPNFALDLMNASLGLLRESPDLYGLLELGHIIDVGRHPVDLVVKDYHENCTHLPAADPKFAPEKQDLGVNGSFVADPFWKCPPLIPIVPGLLRPDFSWHQELCELWEHLLPGVLIPELSQEDDAIVSSFRTWTERQINRVRVRLGGADATSSLPTVTASNAMLNESKGIVPIDGLGQNEFGNRDGVQVRPAGEWIKDDEWCVNLRLGVFAIGRRQYTLVHGQLKLLEILVNAGSPLTSLELIDELYRSASHSSASTKSEDSKKRDALRKLKYELREELSKALGIPRTRELVISEGTGMKTIWHLRPASEVLDFMQDS